MQDKNIEKEAIIASTTTGVPLADIEKAIAEMVTKGYDEETAFCLWKSENANLFGGRVAEITMRVLSISDPQVVKPTKEGKEPYTVARVYAFVGVDGKLEKDVLYDASFYNDRIALLDGVSEGELYDCKAKLVAGNGDQLPKLRVLGEGKDIIKASTATFPTTEQLVQKIGVHNISEADNYMKKSEFFTGIVGRVFKYDGGHGLELVSIKGIPVTVYVNGPETDKTAKGKKITVFGYVNQDKGGKTQINARAVI
ncbi:MAG: hypothetical protein WC444_05715 [Candidatus Paceibacterota bacterium]